MCILQPPLLDTTGMVWGLGCSVLMQASSVDGSGPVTLWHPLPVSAGQVSGGSGTLHRGTYVSPTDELKYNQVHPFPSI